MTPTETIQKMLEDWPTAMISGTYLRDTGETVESLAEGLEPKPYVFRRLCEDNYIFVRPDAGDAMVTYVQDERYQCLVDPLEGGD